MLTKTADPVLICTEIQPIYEGFCKFQANCDSEIFDNELNLWNENIKFIHIKSNFSSSILFKNLNNAKFELYGIDST